MSKKDETLTKEEKPKKEERPKAGEKQKKEAKPKGGKKIYTYYEIVADKLNRKLKKCPRCGSFMGLHKGQHSRWVCGSCSYTDYSVVEKAIK